MNGLVTIFGLATYYLGTHDCMQVWPIGTYALIEDSGAHSVINNSGIKKCILSYFIFKMILVFNQVG